MLNRYELQTGSSHEVFGKVKLYTLEVGLGLGAENEIQSVNLKLLIIIFNRLIQSQLKLRAASAGRNVEADKYFFWGVTFFFQQAAHFLSCRRSCSKHCKHLPCSELPSIPPRGIYSIMPVPCFVKNLLQLLAKLKERILQRENKCIEAFAGGGLWLF